MNKKEIIYSFNTILDVAESVKCKDLHHKKSQYHKYGEVCPVEYELHMKAEKIREYMKEQGI